ncbi:uncharacterized protein PFL1_03173 [Pseudozyma flocculosa PF-1]|uniref:Hamartin n=2 Tax=Pseudozyma flocculosa TaxID=84751 RepID=A0A5C3F3T5_9BASI|nr:uncharacterized protein PFL1_03173 [Pseudozyma flocculosa PF-1]EPQ29418.1 hypothetical protein PFL1_03173 [Pseudozyma flocculosa PF-1]SPO37941.1 uncharacterized protein PSFLO_03418 [Pseudozyma flocculosa]
MPPPSFSHPASTVSIPRSVQSWIKDVCQKMRAALLATDDAQRAELIRTIANSVTAQVDSLEASANAEAKKDPAQAGASSSSTAQIKAQVAAKINVSLLDIFHGELEKQQQQKLPVVVELLHVLLPLIGTHCIVMSWWDLVLRPLLKSSAVQNATASKARELAVAAMAAAPASAYEDEPAPIPQWPAPSAQQSMRQAGDAPYPITSVTPQSQQARKSQLDKPAHSTAASSSLRSTSVGSSAASRVDQYRRFTQRIFDLYISETATTFAASSSRDGPGGSSQAGNEETGAHADDRSTMHEDEMSIVWRGNLESTILIYSNQRPKEFFHHIAESFVEPTGRVSLLCLLTTFLRLYTIHTYHITSTALPRLLVLSLQLDTSTTCTALGVTALVMLMPHIPDYIANGGGGGLSTLLAIYGRIVDWRKLGSGWEDRVGGGTELEALRREKDEEYTEIDRLGKRLNIKASLRWRRLESTFDTADSVPPNAEQLFTYLYGLFPCNVIRFLRAPIYYLRETLFDSPFEGPWEDMIDEMAVQSRSHPILRRHTLHPALISLNAERELTDKQRWLKHDSADINAECMSLFLGKWHDVNNDHIKQAERERHVFFEADTGIDDDSMSVPSERKPNQSGGAMRRRSSGPHPGSFMSEMARNFHHLPTTVSPDGILLTYASLRSGAPLASNLSGGHGDESGSRESRQASGSGSSLRMIPAVSATAATSTATASGVPSSVPGSPATHAARARARTRSGSMSSVISLLPPAPGSPTSKQHPLSTSFSPVDHSVPDPIDTTHSTKPASSSELAFVHRENLLLRNELNFELYLKEQHLRHIGKLHRDRVTDTALEAERQNLYHTVRSLRGQLTAMNTILDRQRSEAATTKNRHVHWEAELNNKLKAYREERKAWTTEARQLKAQAEESAATIAALSRQLEESGAELFELKTRLQSVEPKVARIEQYEAKLSQLTTCLTHWDNDVLRYQEQRKEMERLLSRWEEMVSMLESTEAALQHAEMGRRKLEAENESVKAQLEAAFARLRAVQSGEQAGDVESNEAKRGDSVAAEELGQERGRTQSQGQGQGRSAPTSTAMVDALAAAQKERDDLRSQNEALAEMILDLKARLEAGEAEGAYRDSLARHAALLAGQTEGKDQQQQQQQQHADEQTAADEEADQKDDEAAQDGEDATLASAVEESANEGKEEAEDG